MSVKMLEAINLWKACYYFTSIYDPDNCEKIYINNKTEAYEYQSIVTHDDVYQGIVKLIIESVLFNILNIHLHLSRKCKKIYIIFDCKWKKKFDIIEV